MDATTSAGKHFENLVFEVVNWFFGGDVIRPDETARYRPDFYLFRLGLIGEVKFYSSMRVPRGVTEVAVFQLTNVMREVGGTTAVLITTEIESYERINLNENLAIVRWGIPELLYMCRGNKQVRGKLLDFLKSALPFSSVEYSERVPDMGMAQFDWGSDPNNLADVGTSAVSKGIHLDFCSAYKSLGHEKADARRFESLCVDALQYALGEHFGKWEKQARSDTGLSIMDMVVRIASIHDFWKMICEDFKSRYVVFEFKWYRDPIGQSEIYTTEKYLYRNALRSVSIIISGSGINDNGVAAARGALREHGKLIVPITADQLCQMVVLKRNGEDPVTILSDAVDEILLRLER